MKIENRDQAKAFAIFMINEMIRHCNDIDFIRRSISNLKDLINQNGWKLEIDIERKMVDGEVIDHDKAWVNLDK